MEEGTQAGRQTSERVIRDQKSEWVSLSLSLFIYEHTFTSMEVRRKGEESLEYLSLRWSPLCVPQFIP